MLMKLTTEVFLHFFRTMTIGIVLLLFAFRIPFILDTMEAI